MGQKVLFSNSFVSNRNEGPKPPRVSPPARRSLPSPWGSPGPPIASAQSEGQRCYEIAPEFLESRGKTRARRTSDALPGRWSRGGRAPGRWWSPGLRGLRPGSKPRQLKAPNRRILQKEFKHIQKAGRSLHLMTQVLLNHRPLRNKVQLLQPGRGRAELQAHYQK